MKRVLFSFVALLCAITSNAQIGYQVSLLNTATGEPRANETVSCTATLSGQKSTIFTSTQNITSNEFGVLSLTIGNADMFKNVDWTAELPLFVEVAVGGKTIAKSQVLSVPVAETAKTIIPVDCVGKWYNYNNGRPMYLIFHDNKTYERYYSDSSNERRYGEYFVAGNIIYMRKDDSWGDFIMVYHDDSLYTTEESGDIFIREN